MEPSTGSSFLPSLISFKTSWQSKQRPHFEPGIIVGTKRKGTLLTGEHSVTIGNHKCEEALIMTKLSNKFMAEENVTHLNSTSCTSVSATPTLSSNKLTKLPPIADWAFLASAPSPSWEKLTWICRKNQNQLKSISLVTWPHHHSVQWINLRE